MEHKLNTFEEDVVAVLERYSLYDDAYNKAKTAAIVLSAYKTWQCVQGERDNRLIMETFKDFIIDEGDRYQVVNTIKELYFGTGLELDAAAIKAYDKLLNDLTNFEDIELIYGEESIG